MTASAKMRRTVIIGAWRASSGTFGGGVLLDSSIERANTGVKPPKSAQGCQSEQLWRNLSTNGPGP